MDRKPHLFVRIDDYKDTIDIITLLKKKVMDAKRILNSINSLKEEEDTEIEQWNSNIEEMENKIDYINRSMFE